MIAKSLEMTKNITKSTIYELDAKNEYQPDYPPTLFSA